MINHLTKLSTLLTLIMVSVGCQKEAAVPVDINETIETKPPVLSFVINQVNDASGGFLCAVPYNYNQTTKKYPLLVSIHGGGQVGNGNTDLPLLFASGVPQLLDDKKFPPNFKVKGKNFSFIILAPQFNRYPSVYDVESFIVFAKSTYRVDTSRIYLTGLSMGGIVSFDVGADYAAHLSAIIPMAGAPAVDVNSKCRNIARANLPVWAFHNLNDAQITYTEAANMVTDINSYKPAVTAKITLFPAAGHDAWTKATDPLYKENNMNIYEWMLQYSR